ncbi:putative BTB/POZ domain-containing protein [Cotonvirus japonicus]|uniref:BTB/POZ domain-containing protein n=1 Tax=Cotonvirus japonicus TaxID=2811091 RepID=A0ABM7NU89_9VIRU|nr:putative BTB/POZ domain-containing protein [Cotonvirus japonicus]BCS83742.1 putative BTB/POZ domain-containing protein [Cotonvirus japonicus]
MNSERLMKSYIDKVFCDLKLTIVDDDQAITIDTHKIILYTCCPYFEKLLLFNDKNCTEKTINVPNAQMCHDIIESFYSEKNDLNLNLDLIYKFQLYMCRDFFGLKQHKNILSNLKISDDLFDELLRFVELNSHNDNIIKLLFHYIPENYDFKQIPKNLLLVIKKYISNSKMYILSDNSELVQYDLCSENLLSENITHKILKINYDLKKYKFSLNDNEIAIMKGGSIGFYDINNGTLINQILINQIPIDDITNIKYRDNNLFIVVNYKRLVLIDNNNGKLLKTHEFKYSISYITSTTNCIYVHFNLKNKIAVLDSKTLKLLTSVNYYNSYDYVNNKMIFDDYLKVSDSTYIYEIDVLSDKITTRKKISGKISALDVDFRFEKYVVVDSTNIIKIFDVASGKLISEYNIDKLIEIYELEHYAPVLKAKFLHDSRYIVIKIKNGRYFILDTKKQKIIKISPESKFGYWTNYQISYHSQYLSEIDDAIFNLSNKTQ